MTFCPPGSWNNGRIASEYWPASRSCGTATVRVVDAVLCPFTKFANEEPAGFGEKEIVSPGGIPHAVYATV